MWVKMKAYPQSRPYSIIPEEKQQMAPLLALSDIEPYKKEASAYKPSYHPLSCNQLPILHNICG